jgi:hypothetical protein
MMWSIEKVPRSAGEGKKDNEALAKFGIFTPVTATARCAVRGDDLTAIGIPWLA